MDYCLYNAIKTPDGTVLWCESGHDYKSHTDSISNEFYMNDGVGYSVRRSVNKVPFEDLSIWMSQPYELVRTAKFWGSYGKDGKSPKKMMCLEEMESEHVKAILATQRHLDSTIQSLFLKELEFRAKVMVDNLESQLPKKSNVNKKFKA